MLTVVRRAVPGSTRPRRRAAAAAVGAQQQSSTLYQTSTTASSSDTSTSVSSFSLAASGSSAAPAGRPSSSTPPSKSYATLSSPRWEGVANQGCGTRTPAEARFVGQQSPGTSGSGGGGGGSSRSITTQSGGAQQQQQQGQARGAAAGAGSASEMVVTAKHLRGGARGCAGGGAAAAAAASTTTRRWLWTAAAVTAVTAVTAAANTASAAPCKPDNSIHDACPCTAAAAAMTSTSPPSPSSSSVASSGCEDSGNESGTCACGSSRSISKRAAWGAGDARRRQPKAGDGEGAAEAGAAASEKTAWWQLSPALATSLAAAAAAAAEVSMSESGRGEGAEEGESPATAAALAASVAAALSAGNDDRATRTMQGGRARPPAPPSWLDASAGGRLLRGASSALYLRGGVRAMGAAAAGGGGGGGGGGGKGGGREKKGGGVASKDGGRGGDGGERRGKNIPLAGRPLFTSVASTKGHRPHMEDEFFLSADGSFSAVYDGHGGANVSGYLRRNLYKHVMDHLPPGDAVYGLKTVQEALRSAFKCADDYVVTQTPYGNEGSCAVSVTVHCDREGKVSIISCNLGDSRAVLSRGGKALDLTEDHKPNAPREMERIYRHDGMVTWEGFECSQGLQIEGTGVYRINGNLAVARAIGDIDYRPWVSAEVEIKTIELKRESDQFIILASDGLWDVMSSDEAVQYVHAVMGGAMGSGKEGDKWSGGGGGGGDKLGAAAEAGGDKPPHMTLVNWTQSYAEDRGMIRAATMLRKKKMAGYLAEEALRRGSMDNTTVAIVWLQ